VVTRLKVKNHGTKASNLGKRSALSWVYKF